MKVTVDEARCQGHKRCVAVAPELFEVDDLGYARAIGDGVVHGAGRLAAALAVANCPEFAISIAYGGAAPMRAPEPVGERATDYGT